MSAHRHFAFVIHGSRAELPATRELIDRVRGEGHRVDPCITYTPGDAERFARDGAEEGATVVALGGDGTLNEVVNGLDGHDVPLGIVPMGTANDFARQMGIPLEPDHAMDVILARKPVRIDTAELNGRRFLNVSTGGVGAEATAETPAEAKEALGPVAYAITGVRKLAALEPRHATFAGPNFRLECGFFTFAVGNGRTTGGGTVITPLARLDDGLLDLVVFETMSRRDVPAAIMRVRRGEHLEAEGVHYAQLPEVCITSAEPLSVNVDGEPLSAARLEYRARALDLRVHLPPGALAVDKPKQNARRR
jgi:lipid kinase YegS